ncbi:Hypothetical predicted protein [Olea europaea subsp. europaea]|uniref:Uncharacterized protein n=1 Tax=Olea europaea subsp. europaea TaxID=158383 RepID=A0A8S0QJ33_OLEEU|nr:Hypothetical predicted protein [Olea europaea subsp. europaea]
MGQNNQVLLAFSSDANTRLFVIVGIAVTKQWRGLLEVVMRRSFSFASMASLLQEKERWCRSAVVAMVVVMAWVSSEMVLPKRQFVSIGFGLIFGVFGKVLGLNVNREEVEVVMLVVESNSLVDVWRLQRKRAIACSYEQRIFHVVAVV